MFMCAYHMYCEQDAVEYHNELKMVLSPSVRGYAYRIAYACLGRGTEPASASLTEVGGKPKLCRMNGAIELLGWISRRKRV